MGNVWPEVFFIVFLIAGWSAAYLAILPRLIVNPISAQNNAHPTRPTLSGGGLLAWSALMAVLNLAGFGGYEALVGYRSAARLDFICNLAVGTFFVFFRHPTSVEARDPDVRFGTFLGALIGGVGVLLLLVSRYR